jgi:hypothetical protein
LHQEHADLEELLLPVGQQPGWAMTRLAEADGLQHFVDAVLLLAVELGSQTRPYRLVGFLRQLQILEHAERFEHRGLLEFATDASLGDVHLAHAGQVEGFAEPGAAAGGARLAGDDVHHGGLAGAVGADDAAQLADADVQAEVRQRLEAVEADVDVFQAEDGAVAYVQALLGDPAEADGIAGQATAGGVEAVDDGAARYGFHCSPLRLIRPMTPLGR